MFNLPVSIIFHLITMLVSSWLCLNMALAISGELMTERRLFNNVFANIDPDARPAPKDSEPVQVQFSMNLLSVVDLDMKNEVLTSHVYFSLSWNDPQIVWDPKDNAGVSFISVDHQRIWRPAFEVLNEMHDNKEKTLYPKATISFKGKVIWEPRLRIKTACAVSVEFFPFDTQECTYMIGLWSDIDQTVNLTTTGDLLNTFRDGNFTYTVELSTEFTLISHSFIRRAIEHINFDFSIGFVSMSQQLFTIVLKRKTLYYVYTLFIPSILISFLSILIFLLSPGSGEKISLGITSVLVLQVMLSGVSDSMPKTSSGVPLVAIFLTIIMILSCLSIIFSVITIKIRATGLGKMAKFLRKSSADEQMKSYKNKMAIISKEMENNDEGDPTNVLLQIHRSNMLAFYEKQMKLAKRSQEAKWMDLADTLDRIFFWLFCAVLVVHTVLMLIVIPTY